MEMSLALSVPKSMVPAARSQGCLLAPVAVIVLTASLALSAPPSLFAKATPRSAPIAPYERAQRQREALEGRPEQQRTRRDYERVLDAYRAIYHGDPAAPKADASIAAVAELLAEEGRIFEDGKALHDALGQYEFLRREYPYSRLRASALLTEGEIFYHDLNDRASAKSAFQQFLKTYQNNPLADQARQSLRQIRKDELAEKRGGGSSKTKTAKNAPPSLPVSPAPQATAPLSAQSIPSPQPQEQREQPRPQAMPDSAEVKSPAASEPVVTEDTSFDTPPPRHGQLPFVTGIRHWSTSVYTRVAIDLDSEVKYEAARVPNPDRIYFDLHGVKLTPELIGKSIMVTDDGFLKRIRAAQFSNDITRVVLDVSDVSEYSAFLLPNPYRLIIDIHGTKPASAAQQTAKVAPPQTPPAPQPQTKPADNIPAKATPPPRATPEKVNTVNTAPSPAPSVETPQSASSLKEVASLGDQPNRLKATKKPTTEPIAASVAEATPASSGNSPSAKTSSSTPPVPPPQDLPAPRKSRSKHSNPPPADAAASVPPIHEAEPTAAGERSLVRALGLKIGRIVVDAGHGGHDSGTLGPDGIQEKDIVLDVALRVGKLLTQQLGADVIYTRDDDTFIPLETRTAIANKSQADLFLSIHANSSRDASARGVETYYLNFTASPDALEVAARENAVSQQSVHELSDLVKKITLKDKIEESREFAVDVQSSLYDGLQKGNPGLKDRGVKKAPFVVLIGANMPSILAEISFLTNPDDAHELRDPDYRQRIAESIYRGVAKYISGLSGVRVAQTNNHGNNN
jgi:N-acetylmuramoyl-L-alanine amidase